MCQGGCFFSQHETTTFFTLICVHCIYPYIFRILKKITFNKILRSHFLWFLNITCKSTWNSIYLLRTPQTGWNHKIFEIKRNEKPSMMNSVWIKFLPLNGSNFKTGLVLISSILRADCVWIELNLYPTIIDKVRNMYEVYLITYTHILCYCFYIHFHKYFHLLQMLFSQAIGFF